MGTQECVESIPHSYHALSPDHTLVRTVDGDDLPAPDERPRGVINSKYPWRSVLFPCLQLIFHGLITMWDTYNYLNWEIMTSSLSLDPVSGQITIMRCCNCRFRHGLERFASHLIKFNGYENGVPTELVTLDYQTTGSLWNMDGSARS